MKKYTSIILNILALLFGAVGLYVSFFPKSGFMDADTIWYYTIQSNIFVMIVAAISLFFEFHKLKGKSIPNAIYTLRFVCTVDITLTFLVFSLMLTPIFIKDNNTAYLLSIGNLCVHNLLPLAAIFDWCFFGKSNHIKTKQILLALIFPFFYCVLMLIRSFLGITISGNLVPYFFLDYQASGWLKIGKNGIGVIYWIIILALALVGMCLFFRKVCKKHSPC